MLYLFLRQMENHAMAHILPHPGHDSGDEILLHLPLIPAAAGPRPHSEIWQWKNPSSAIPDLTWYQCLGTTERLEQRQEDKKMWSPEPAAPGREAGTAHPWSCGTSQCLTHLEGNTALRCVGSPSCAHCSLGCGCS